MSELFPAVRHYVDERIVEFGMISEQRKTQLRGLTSYVQDCLRAHQPVRLTFICTHNSRRSHLSQIWAAVAAVRFKVMGVETFSGGTEATAFAPPAIAALRRAGLEVISPNESNPRHEVHFGSTGQPLICFSKVYSDAPNPTAGYCAVMTCTHADAHCPIVHGSTQRLSIPFEDPKVSDGSAVEAATYDERCRQIAREMLYAFAQVH
ncbi:MAG: protein-tyrosine-phosphatase [Planctomycetes bacterium]|nr:protein-tyrosine-phosphatase [Planctomycetota bacterium]